MSKYIDLARVIDMEPSTASVLDLCDDEDILEEFESRLNENFMKEFFRHYCLPDEKKMIKDLLDEEAEVQNN